MLRGALPACCATCLLGGCCCGTCGVQAVHACWTACWAACWATSRLCSWLRCAVVLLYCCTDAFGAAPSSPPAPCSKEGAWKLVDFENWAWAGQPADVSYALRYSSPEVCGCLCVSGGGGPAGRVNPDSWSTGLAHGGLYARTAKLTHTAHVPPLLPAPLPLPYPPCRSPLLTWRVTPPLPPTHPLTCLLWAYWPSKS